MPTTKPKKKKDSPAPEDPKLKPAEETFCQLYAGSREFFNNATQAYMIAYEYKVPEVPELTYPAPEKVQLEETDFDTGGSKAGAWAYPDWYEKELDARDAVINQIERLERTAAACASRLLTKAKIRQRCAEVLRSRLKDEDVDTELAHLVLQRDDNAAKLGAIREFNKLKGRITERRLVTGIIGTGELSEEDKAEMLRIMNENKHD